MAIETTLVVPILTTFPFNMNGMVGQDNPAPRHILQVSALNAVVAAPGASTNSQIRVDVNLPPNFSYVVTELAAQITQLTANVYDDIAFGSLSDATDTNFRLIEFPLEMVSLGASTVVLNFIKQYRPAAPLPTFQILPMVGGAQGSFLQFFWNNDTDNTTAATFNFVLRLLVFNVDQAYDVAVNQPVLIR